MSSVGQSVQYGYTLDPGNGCYIQIDRLQMGSIGSMALFFDDPSSILVFDGINRNYQSGDVLNMQVSDYGWAPRKVFVVNRGQQQAGISVIYQNSIINRVSGMLAVAIGMVFYVLA